MAPHDDIYAWMERTGMRRAAGDPVVKQYVQQIKAGRTPERVPLATSFDSHASSAAARSGKDISSFDSANSRTSLNTIVTIGIAKDMKLKDAIPKIMKKEGPDYNIYRWIGQVIGPGAAKDPTVIQYVQKINDRLSRLTSSTTGRASHRHVSMTAIEESIAAGHRRTTGSKGKKKKPKKTKTKKSKLPKKKKGGGKKKLTKTSKKLSKRKKTK